MLWLCVAFHPALWSTWVRIPNSKTIQRSPVEGVGCRNLPRKQNLRQSVVQKCSESSTNIPLSSNRPIEPLLLFLPPKRILTIANDARTIPIVLSFPLTIASTFAGSFGFGTSTPTIGILIFSAPWEEDKSSFALPRLPAWVTSDDC